MKAPCAREDGDCPKRTPGCQDRCAAFAMYKKVKAAAKNREKEYASSFPLSWHSRGMFLYKRDRKGKMRTITK